MCTFLGKHTEKTNIGWLDNHVSIVDFIIFVIVACVLVACVIGPPSPRPLVSVEVGSMSMLGAKVYDMAEFLSSGFSSGYLKKWRYII